VLGRAPVAARELGDPALGAAQLLDEIGDGPVERRRDRAMPLLVEARAAAELPHDSGHPIRARPQAFAFERGADG
jgi:hypothetical protein